MGFFDFFLSEDKETAVFNFRSEDSAEDCHRSRDACASEVDRVHRFDRSTIAIIELICTSGTLCLVFSLGKCDL